MSWGSACKTKLIRVLTKQNQCVRCTPFNRYLQVEDAHKIQNDSKGMPAIFSVAVISEYL